MLLYRCGSSWQRCSARWQGETRFRATSGQVAYAVVEVLLVRHNAAQQCPVVLHGWILTAPQLQDWPLSSQTSTPWHCTTPYWQRSVLVNCNIAVMWLPLSVCVGLMQVPRAPVGCCTAPAAYPPGQHGCSAAVPAAARGGTSGTGPAPAARPGVVSCSGGMGAGACSCAGGLLSDTPAVA
jgi:hypothetical protein